MLLYIFSNRLKAKRGLLLKVVAIALYSLILSKGNEISLSGLSIRPLVNSA